MQLKISIACVIFKVKKKSDTTLRLRYDLITFEPQHKVVNVTFNGTLNICYPLCTQNNTV